MTDEQYLDVMALSQRVDADAKFMVELYQLFLVDSKKLIVDIYDSVDRNDAGALQLSAHTLKGSSASVSAILVLAISTELEQMAIANDMSSASATIEKLKQCYELTNLEIQSNIVRLLKIEATL